MLNEAQHRHVNVTLRMAEEHLLDLRRQVAGGCSQGDLFSVENDLTDAERAFVLANSPRPRRPSIPA